jgi:phosphonate transport system substrate-binding protein
MKKRVISISVLLILVLIAGCERGEKASQKIVKVEPAPEKTLLIGLIPEQNIFRQIERYRPLSDYVSKRLGMTIRLTVLPRYGNIIDNFRAAGMDGAFFGSFSYVLAHEKLGVEVVARPLSLNGTSTYHGLIFVRKDSGIRSLSQMRGKRFVFVDKGTTAGYLLPLAYFKEHNENYRTFLKESYFAGTHEDAILDVLNKKADMGGAKNTVYERLSDFNSAVKSELAILKRSPDVPENGLAVRKGLNPTLKEMLRRIFLTLHETPEGVTILTEFGAQRFIETHNRDYEPVYLYARQIGLNLATYDYMNE